MERHFFLRRRRTDVLLGRRVLSIGLCQGNGAVSSAVESLIYGYLRELGGPRRPVPCRIGEWKYAYQADFSSGVRIRSGYGEWRCQGNGAVSSAVESLIYGYLRELGGPRRPVPCRIREWKYAYQADFSSGVRIRSGYGEWRVSTPRQLLDRKRSGRERGGRDRERTTSRDSNSGRPKRIGRYMSARCP
ncbi:hypothetical protein DPX16_17989 [Anabarilius grahami]|uniref:Uncharacterized protein n=1 Tax=Anabarilius grahami TaxID=495550 RepID=A0A3N0XT15_ANAGA|nr:hypothetical protein DPX16_17989 [Anabarilius grahami]